MLHALNTLPLLAAGGGAEIRSLLVLLGIIAAAYLITHLLVERLQRRFGFVTGVEYILFGAITGPALGILNADSLAMFTPAEVLGTGSLGLLTGLRLNLRRFDSLEVEALRIALWQTLLTLAALVGVPLLVLQLGAPEIASRWLPGLLCVGAVGVVADPSPVQAMRRFLSSRGDASDVAIRAARMCSSLAIIVFGVLFCLYNPGARFLQEQFAALEWFAVHLVIGSVLGATFATFLRQDLGSEKTLTVVMGMVIFTSGIAYYLKLSPIFVNFIMGIVLVNLSARADLLADQLASVERPIYIILFFFAGASLALNAPWWAYLAPLLYLALRSAGRFLGGVIAVRTSADLRFPSLGRVLLAPGGLSVAMLLNFQEVYGALTIAPAVYTGLLVALLASEIFAYSRIRAWLIDNTDVPPSKIREAFQADNAEVV